MKRADDFDTRRRHLADLSEEELERRFWELCARLMDPVVELAETHTTPSIERSVLLRMGFSSLESKDIVEGALQRQLLGHGAGHLVYKLSQSRKENLLQTGRDLASGQNWDETAALFKGEEVEKTSKP